MPTASVRHTLQFALRFLFSDAAIVWTRIALPLVAGGLALYASFNLYLLQFERYLLRPNDRSASLVLGIATAGLLLTLFCHSVTCATISSLALKREDRGWKYFCVSRRAWRTYAAYLRFLVIAAAFVSVVEFIRYGIDAAGGVSSLGMATNLLLLVGLIALVIRPAFLIAPVAAISDRGPVVRGAWRLSSGYSLKLAATVTALALPGFGIEAIGEFALRLMGLNTVVEHGTTLAEVVVRYRATLPGVMIAIGVAYAATIVLLVSAAADMYRQIASNRPNS